MGIFDILAMAIFAGLVVLFLKRSTGDGPYPDHLWQYLAASASCAVANYLGNNGQPALAIALILGTLYFIQQVLHPFAKVPPK